MSTCSIKMCGRGVKSKGVWSFEEILSTIFVVVVNALLVSLVCFEFCRGIRNCGDAAGADTTCNAFDLQCIAAAWHAEELVLLNNEETCATVASRRTAVVDGAGINI